MKFFRYILITAIFIFNVFSDGVAQTSNDLISSNSEKSRKRLYKIDLAYPISINEVKSGIIDYSIGISLFRYSFLSSKKNGYTQGGNKIIFLELTHTVLKGEILDFKQFFGLKIPYKIFLYGDFIIGELGAGIALDESSNLNAQFNAGIKMTLNVNRGKYFPELEIDYRRFQNSFNDLYTRDFISVGMSFPI